MSFILDAIKKSENERQRSKQPDVHSLQDSVPQAPVQSSTVSRLLLLIIAIVIIIAAVWWLWLQMAPQLSPRLVELLQGNQTSPVVVETNNTEAVALPIKKDPQSQYSADDELPPNNQIKELWQLPADYQSTIPDLEFSFHVFSDNPDERMIIINGRRMREGQLVSRGLSLRVITDTGVILHSGGRFFHVDVIEKW